jgi:hypothetical protein
MRVCKHCGGEIIFRYIDGVVVPLCPCGGCRDEAVSRPISESLVFEHERDFCRPAWCRKCNASVFFIRHNGGSLWVDELGWPWPKHPCFDSAPGAAQLAILHQTATHLHRARGAVVTRVVFVNGARECIASITTPGAATELWVVREIQDPHKLLGALVALSLDERKLVVPGGTTYGISVPMLPCPVCEAQFLANQIDQHMADSHSIVRCHICRAFIRRGALEAHSREHKRELKRGARAQKNNQYKFTRAQQYPPQ